MRDRAARKKCDCCLLKLERVRIRSIDVLACTDRTPSQHDFSTETF